MTRPTPAVGDSIDCACGCGEQIERRGANGKPRRFQRGHQTKGRRYKEDPQHFVRRLGKLNTRAGLCACGCGGQITISASWLRERQGQPCTYLPKYIAGHMPEIPCACGCGEMVGVLGARNRHRRCVEGHGGGLADLSMLPRKDWGVLAADWNRFAPSCGCGCGVRLSRTAKQLREGLPDAGYLPGHSQRRAWVGQLTHEEESVIYGSLLGDMSISRPAKSPRLGFTHGIDQLAYAQHKMDVLKRLSWWSGITPSLGFTTASVVRGSSSCLPVLEDVWGRVRSGGGKQVTPVWLAEVGARGLAYWFMDDGSVGRSSSGRISSFALHTEGFPRAEQETLAAWLWSLGIKVRIRPSRQYFYLYIPKDGARVLRRRILPFIHESMRYKVDGAFTD